MRLWVMLTANIVAGAWVPRAAQADDNVAGGYEVLVGFPLLAAGIAAGITAGVTGQAGGPPSLAGKIFGYAGGGLNLVWGGIMTAAAVGAKTNGATLGAFALGHLALGVIDIGVTVYRSTRPVVAPRRLSIVPIVGLDSRAQLFGGLALRAFTW